MIKRKSNELSLKWLAVVVLAVVFVGPALAQEEPPPLDEELQMPGIIEGTGTYFKVTDSEYLNITLISSEPVNLRLESVPQMVVMDIEAAEGAASSQITLTGFAPSTTYYKYQDGYQNEATFTTDETGSYSYTQDLSSPHLVFIQPEAGTIYLSDTGWSKPGIGNWDPITKTATLTTNVYETIQINSNGITLDGNGNTVIGSGVGYGVYLFHKTDVTIQNLNVQGFDFGIYPFRSSNNTLTGNDVESCRIGIFLYYESQSNNVIENTVKNCRAGLYLYNSSGNTLIDNNAISNNLYGIFLYRSSSNTLTGNNANLNNPYGIRLYVSSNNILTGNTVSNNSYAGIQLNDSSNNTLIGNTISNNSICGIYLQYNSNGNQIYNNNFIDNSTQAYVESNCSGNIFNLSAPTGGNYWNNWTSPDDNGDGFVDNWYIFTGGHDELPWTRNDGWLNQAPIADAGPDQIVEQTSSEGAEVQLDGSESYDPDEDELTYEWTWDDGSATGEAPIVQLPPGVTTITLTVSDGKLFATDTVEITIEDTIPPEISIYAPEPYGLYAVGGLVLDFSVTDATCEPTVLAILYIDDDELPVETSFMPEVGVYIFGIMAWDDAGNTAFSDPVFFVVYDPDGGFVTGGGWIYSEAGAYKLDLSSEGKANFGFVSKYKKGATVPTGNTEFQFQAGDLNFRSSSYDWLVVNQVGTNAQFKGSGTINGEGDYRFMLWAGDGEPDTFRIRIWEEDEISGVETDIYDNGFKQEIGGGSIVVHTK